MTSLSCRELDLPCVLPQQNHNLQACCSWKHVKGHNLPDLEAMLLPLPERVRDLVYPAVYMEHFSRCAPAQGSDDTLLGPLPRRIKQDDLGAEIIGKRNLFNTGCRYTAGQKTCFPGAGVMLFVGDGGPDGRAFRIYAQNLFVAGCQKMAEQPVATVKVQKRLNRMRLEQCPGHVQHQRHHGLIDLGKRGGVIEITAAMMADSKVRFAEEFFELQDIGGLPLLKIIIRTTRVRIDIGRGYRFGQLPEVNKILITFFDKK